MQGVYAGVRGKPDHFCPSDAIQCPGEGAWVCVRSIDNHKGIAHALDDIHRQHVVPPGGAPPSALPLLREKLLREILGGDSPRPHLIPREKEDTGPVRVDAVGSLAEATGVPAKSAVGPKQDWARKAFGND